MIRVAVVTPYAGEPVPVLSRCIESVRAQTVADRVSVSQTIVGDGHRVPPGLIGGDVYGFHWDTPIKDAGATPRAAGSLCAVKALRVDALAFLDADNAWDPTHLEQCLSVASRSGAPVVVAQRWLCEPETLEPFAVDGESNGREFTDTNCYLLSGQALEFGRLWGVTDPASPYGGNTGADRDFWSRVRESFREHEIAVSYAPTVRYGTRWLVHYNHPNAPPPPARCLMMAQDETGEMRRIWVRPTERTEEGWQYEVEG